MKRPITIALASLILAVMLSTTNGRNKGGSGALLIEEVEEIESFFEFRDSLNPKVSKVAVSWHLDHSLRTIHEIYKAMKASDPEDYKRSFNLGRSLVLISNRIPRGRAESPQVVRPPDIIHTDSLYMLLENARFSLKAYDSLPDKAYFEHPYLGHLRKKTATKFLKIHTEHHLKIIREILIR